MIVLHESWYGEIGESGEIPDWTSYIIDSNAFANIGEVYARDILALTVFQTRYDASEISGQDLIPSSVFSYNDVNGSFNITSYGIAEATFSTSGGGHEPGWAKAAFQLNRTHDIDEAVLLLHFSAETSIDESLSITMTLMNGTEGIETLVVPLSLSDFTLACNFSHVSDYDSLTGYDSIVITFYFNELEANQTTTIAIDRAELWYGG
jgi:hypothetical protein